MRLKISSGMYLVLVMQVFHAHASDNANHILQNGIDG